MAAVLGDDGTMDTVVSCSECNEETRYNFDGVGSYQEFVKWALGDFDETHECDDNHTEAADGKEA